MSWVTIGEVFEELGDRPYRRDEEHERSLCIREICEDLLLKDEEGEEPFWSKLTLRQRYQYAERVYERRSRWVEAHQRKSRQR